MIAMELLRGLVGPSDEKGRIYGVVVGVVTNNSDPEGLERVRVRFPWLNDDDESNWARMAAPMAGKDRGFYYLPEVGDEVLVAFEHGAVDFPFILGALWNGKDNPPETNSDGQNNHRTIKSRSGHIIRFDDSDGGEKIEILDKNKNKIVISSSDDTLTIESRSDISIKSSTGKLKLGGVGVEISSQADVKIEADLTMDVKAAAMLSIQGAMVKIN